MKITITDNRKEAVPNEVYYVGVLFANILSMLQTYGLLKNDAVEQSFAPDAGYCNCPITKTEAVLSGSLCPLCLRQRR